MSLISFESLKKIAPYGTEKNLRGFVDTFNKFAGNYGVNTPDRIHAFISQVAHESDGFKTAKEYASGAKYEGRKDLGNTNKGDGVKFKGRGFIQTTGRNNYSEVSKSLFGSSDVLLSNPSKLEEPAAATLSALHYWKSRKLNEIADKPNTWTTTIKTKSGPKTVNKFQYITYKINGGFNGLKEREGYWAKAKRLISNVVDTGTNPGSVIGILLLLTVLGIGYKNKLFK